jgi:hypothetical protein
MWSRLCRSIRRNIKCNPSLDRIKAGTVCTSYNKQRQIIVALFSIKIKQAHRNGWNVIIHIHVFDTVPFTTFQILLQAILPSPASLCGFWKNFTIACTDNELLAYIFILTLTWPDYYVQEVGLPSFLFSHSEKQAVKGPSLLQLCQHIRNHVSHKLTVYIWERERIWSLCMR